MVSPNMRHNSSIAQKWDWQNYVANDFEDKITPVTCDLHMEARELATLNKYAIEN